MIVAVEMSVSSSSSAADFYSPLRSSSFRFDPPPLPSARARRFAFSTARALSRRPRRSTHPLEAASRRRGSRARANAARAPSRSRRAPRTRVPPPRPPRRRVPAPAAASLVAADVLPARDPLQLVEHERDVLPRAPPGLRRESNLHAPGVVHPSDRPRPLLPPPPPPPRRSRPSRTPRTTPRGRRRSPRPPRASST